MQVEDIEENPYVAIRRALGLSREEAAERIGVPLTSWTLIESGDRSPRRREMDAILSIFAPSEDLVSALEGWAFPGDLWKLNPYAALREDDAFSEMDSKIGAPSGRWNLLEQHEVSPTREEIDQIGKRWGLTKAEISDLKEWSGSEHHSSLLLLRKNLGASQAQASSRTGISRTLWAALENKRRPLTAGYLNRIQQIFDLTDRQITEIRKWWGSADVSSDMLERWG